MATFGVVRIKIGAALLKPPVYSGIDFGGGNSGFLKDA
jgi:hypothetical protein